jgi:thiol-disulfide isomerase/thioredoxin
VNIESERALRKLSFTASISFVLMVAVTVGYIVWPRVAGAIGFKPAAPPPQPPAYLASELIDVPAYWYNDAPKTLVLFARASCGACDKARPFLASLVSGLGGRAKAVMAHPAGAEADDLAFAQSLGIPENQIRKVTANLRVKATPTIVLVNQQGTILAAWEGAGAEARQVEIRTTIDRLLK